MASALSAGVRRMFIDLDITNGDETYTALKNTLPTVLRLLLEFDEGSVQVVFPDAGAAALAKRDWGEQVNARHLLVGIEQYKSRGDDDTAVMLVVPRASEVDDLGAVVDGAGDAPVIMINPDLVDMGVTGLSLNARRLRTAVIDTFDNVFYLRVFGWGVLYRCYSGKWSVWVDDSNEPNGFRFVDASDKKPSNDELDDILDSDNTGRAGGNALGNMMSGFKKMLNIYMKG